MTDPIHKFPPKDPGERLAYTWDFTNLLATVELISTINSVVIEPATGILLVNEGSAIVAGNKKITVVLSGGKDCIEYIVSVNVTTDTGAPANIFERSCIVRVEDR